MRTVLTLPAWHAADAPAPITAPTGDTVALLSHQTVLDPAFDGFLDSHPGATIIAWSGHPDADTADPFARTPEAWLPGALPALLTRLETLEPTLTRLRIRLLIRPHARHVFSDAPRCAAILRAPWRSASTCPHIGIALDPVAMLEPSMLATATDHIRRTLESLADRASLVVLTGFLPPDPGDPEAPIRPAPIGTSTRFGADLAQLAQSLIPADCPLALLPADAAPPGPLAQAPGYTLA
jgi:hypothetical protein